MPISILATDTDNLTHYWSWDTNLNDEVGSWNFTAYGGASVTPTGCKAGSCVTFDGAGDYLRYASPVDDNKSFTIGSWVYYDNQDNDLDDIYIGIHVGGVGYVGGANNGQTWLGDSADQWHFPSDTLTTGAWHHVVARWNASDNNMTVFIDGARSTGAYNTNNTFQRKFGWDDFYLGAYDAGFTTSPFDGLLDDIFIYDIPKTDAEIALLYNGGSGCNPLTEDCDNYTAPSSLTLLLTSFSNATSFNGSYNGTISYTISSVNGSAVCDINDTHYIETTIGPYGNGSLRFFSDNFSLETNYLKINCTDNSNTVNSYIEFTPGFKQIMIFDTDAALYSSTCTYDGDTSINTTFQVQTGTVTDRTFSCEATDEYISFTDTLLNDGLPVNYTRVPLSLILYFSDTVDALVTTTSSTVFYNYNNTLNITQDDLPIGKVSVSFGKSNITKQRYEYYNDQLTYISDNLTVMDKYDEEFYITVQSSSGQGISDAYIYVYEYNATENYTNNVSLRQVGQFMSYNREPTKIYVDSDKLYYIIIEKSGYETVTLPNMFPAEDESTYDLPFKVELQTSSLIQNSPLSIMMQPNPIVNANSSTTVRLNINLPVFAAIAESNLMYIITEYRQTDGAGNGLVQIVANNNTDYWKAAMPYYFYGTYNQVTQSYSGNGIATRSFYTTLYPSVDFNPSADAINLTIYTRFNTAWHTYNYNIPLYTVNITGTNITPDTTYESKHLLIYLFIGLVAVSMFVRFKFQDQSVSFHTYMAGLVVVAAILQSYLILGVLPLVYYGLLWLKKLNGEIA